MSGGSYDYVTFKMDDAAHTLRRNHWGAPHVIALAGLLERIAKVMHDIEWADSGDTTWNDQLDAQIRALLGPGAELDVAREQAEAAARCLSAVLERAKPLSGEP